MNSHADPQEVLALIDRLPDELGDATDYDLAAIDELMAEDTGGFHFSHHGPAVLPCKRFGDHDLPVPYAESELAAGMDLRCVTGVYLPPGTRACIPCGFGFAIPDHLFGKIAPRSGLANDFGIAVLAGVIDADHRGQVKVILVNHGGVPVTFKTGDRIAQLILMPVATSQYSCSEVDDLPPTARGENGFGSTGVT
jgi:dUTP pyrophosphatase